MHRVQNMHRVQAKNSHPSVPATPFPQAVKEMLECTSVRWEAREKSSAAAMQLLIRNTISMCMQGRLSSHIMATLERSAAFNGGPGQDKENEFKTVAEQLRTIIGTADLPMIRVNTDLVISEHNSCAASLLVGP
jgi:hypothetical protein